MLNLCELEMRAPRLARLQRDRFRRDTGLVGALAVELGCRPGLLNVVAALRNTRTIVIVDDLEHWFAPDVSGLHNLERFLSLVIRTREEAFWLVTTCEESLDVLEEAFPLRHAFGHLAPLQPLKRDALIHAIEARHLLSGCPITYPRTFASRLLGRFQGTTDRDMFFQMLASTSEGNLARAMAAWLRSVQVHDDGSVSLRVQGAFSLGFPFISQLSSRDLAVLVQMLRFGPMTAGELTAALGLPRDQTDRHVAFLMMAGMVEPLEPSNDELQVPRVLQAPILLGLRDVGAWP
jgi:hypothetical protein